MHEISLDHTTDTGHRIVGHQGKCARLHGHSYQWEVTVMADNLNDLGFVVDFGDIKDVLNEWDHRLVLWTEDPISVIGPSAITTPVPVSERQMAEIKAAWERPHEFPTQPIMLPHEATFTPVTPDDLGEVRVAFNPTAENMAADRAKAIWQKVGPSIVSVRVWETAKSSAFSTYQGEIG